MADPSLPTSVAALVLAAAHVIAAALKRQTAEYRLAQCEIQVKELRAENKELTAKVMAGELKDLAASEARTRELLDLKEHITVMKNDVSRLVPPGKR